MTVPFRTIQETKGYNDFGQQYSDQIYNATLTQNTATPLTVPGGGIMGAITSGAGSNNKNYVMAVIRVSGNDEVWVANNAIADVPAGSSFAKDTSEIVTSDNPKGMRVAVGDVLSFYTPGATTSVSVAFYALPA